MASNLVSMLEQQQKKKKKKKKKIDEKWYFCPALSSFKVGKLQILQNRIGFSGRNETFLIVQGSQN